MLAQYARRPLLFKCSYVMMALLPQLSGIVLTLVLIFAGDVVSTGVISAALVAGASAKLCALECARFLEGCADSGPPRYAALADSVAVTASSLNLLFFTALQQVYLLLCMALLCWTGLAEMQRWPGVFGGGLRGASWVTLSFLGFQLGVGTAQLGAGILCVRELRRDSGCMVSASVPKLCARAAACHSGSCCSGSAVSLTRSRRRHCGGGLTAFDHGPA